MEQKVKLRQILLKKRKELSHEEVSNLSQKITNKCIETIEWQNINNLHIYRPITKNNEVDTKYLTAYIKNNLPNIKIHIPGQDKKNPVSIEADFDLVLVPTLGFDSNCNRIGYGGGYYDKFIALNHIKQTIGLAYSFCELNSLPTEPHDQKLNMIITDKEILRS